MRYANVSDFGAAVVTARNAVPLGAEPVPAHCLQIGPDDGTVLLTATGDFNSYSGGFAARILDPLHYEDVGYLVAANLGEAQDQRETLAGLGLWFDDWTG